MPILKVKVKDNCAWCKTFCGFTSCRQEIKLINVNLVELIDCLTAGETFEAGSSIRALKWKSLGLFQPKYRNKTTRFYVMIEHFPLLWFNCTIFYSNCTAHRKRHPKEDRGWRKLLYLKIGIVSSSHSARGEEEDVRRYGRNRLLSTGEQNLESREEHNGDGRWRERPAISAVNCVFNGLESHILGTTPLGKCEVSFF